MKISIIGGGPAGMYFAILMKQADALHDITIYERNGPDDTFGWGVVFSGKTLANLRAADEESYAEVTRAFEAWNNVDVVHGAEKISIHGNSFSGIARLQLLKILQRRSEELGVQLLFRTEIPDVDALRTSCDLLVAADGVNSTARKQYSEQFRPALDVRPNRYIWYGTNRLFHGLTLTFRENEAGVFAAHSYKFNQTTSTFIIECDVETWNAAGFSAMSEEQTRRYLEQVFARDLQGQPLLSNNSKWINFLLVKNERWFFENVVLIGDALHTAHFSIGSGTKLALEDSIALFECFETTATIEDALKRFESTRKPVIEAYQAAAYDSMRWFENAREFMDLSPLELAFALMTRSGRVDYEDLKERDPDFICRYEQNNQKCFRLGTKVKTADGWQNIELIKANDLVWTHRGRLRSVLGLQRRSHVGRLLGIRLQGINSVVWCTPDQRFLVAHNSSQETEMGKGGQGDLQVTPTSTPLARKTSEVHRQLGGSNSALHTLRRQLRLQSTNAERLLWERLRGRRLCGAKFRRQHSLGAHYIVDFYCAEFGLAVELDGSVHDSSAARWADGIRHRQIQQAGVRVLRFRNERLLEDLENVLAEIAVYLTPSPQAERGPGGEVGDCSAPTPHPSPLAGRGVKEIWLMASALEVGFQVVTDESGMLATITSVNPRFVNEEVYDLTVGEDHTFITEAGVTQGIWQQ